MYEEFVLKCNRPIKCVILRGKGGYTHVYIITCNTGAFSNGHWKGTYPNIDKQNKQTIWLFTKLRLSLDGREVRSSAHPFSSGKFKLVFNKQSKVINGKLSIGTQRKSRVSGPFCSTNCRSQSEKMYTVSTICVLYHFSTSYWVVVSTKCTIY